MEEVKNNDRYTFIKGDICDRMFVKMIFKEHNINGVIHIAAESLVDVACECWIQKPLVYKQEYQNARFLHISTDEVYGTLGETGLFTKKLVMRLVPPTLRVKLAQI